MLIAKAIRISPNIFDKLLISLGITHYIGKMPAIYLDYNATAPLRPEARDAMIRAMEQTGNPSSIHGYGRAARKIVEDARADVAALTGVKPMQVIFNGGATEGNNTILSGFKNQRVLIGAAEHPSILEAMPDAIKIPLKPDGLIDMNAYADALKDGAALVSVQYVNSETGVIQPIKYIAAFAKQHGAMMHTDAVQAAGRINIDFKDLGVDYLTLSAHKFGGPQGVGALIFRETLQVPNLLKGGGQERRQRAGTENVAGIAGFGAAAKAALADLGTYQNLAHLRDKLESALRTARGDVVIYGETAPRVANTSDVGLTGVPAETQLMAMDLAGVAVSSGSACSSGTLKPSHVLMAMRASEADAKSALRFSLGWATTEADIDKAIAAWIDMANRTTK